MFGLKKENKSGGRGPFEFDLEKELKTDKNKKASLIKEIDENTNELKAMLREGASSENFDQCGVILHGYSALAKVIERATKE